MQLSKTDVLESPTSSQPLSRLPQGGRHYSKTRWTTDVGRNTTAPGTIATRWTTDVGRNYNCSGYYSNSTDVGRNTTAPGTIATLQTLGGIQLLRVL